MPCRFCILRRKKIRKKILKKLCVKVLTSAKVCAIIYKLSTGATLEAALNNPDPRRFCGLTGTETKYSKEYRWAPEISLTLITRCLFYPLKEA